MDAIILCGGKGSRLAGVVDGVPKPLAPVHDRPFLDYVLDYLAGATKLARVILATGHLADAVQAHYGSRYRELALLYSRESSPLGTGGAVLRALRRRALSSPFLLLNGDSFVDADIARMLRLQRDSGAALTMALVGVADAARFGTVTLDGTRVAGFVEKTGVAAPGIINSGIYLVDPAALAPWRAHAGPLSLETQVIPQLMAARGVHGQLTGTRFIDIGLPDTYRAASDFFWR